MSLHLCSRKGTIGFTWLDRCECYCKAKASFSSPINPRLLAATRLKCKLNIQKAGDFSSAQKISIVQPCQCAPSVSFIHIYVHMQVVHTYIQQIYMYCMRSYIYLGVSCQEAIKKKTSEQQA